MERQSSSLEWESPVPTTNRIGQRHRCLTSTMGSLLSTYVDRRQMAPPRDSIPYQLPRIASRLTSHNVLHQEQIPGVQNVEAERESRVFLDSSDWKLHPAVFNRLHQKWGLLNIDLCLPSLLPSSNSHGCIHPGLGDLSGLCLSSICSDRLMPSPNSESAGVTHGVCNTGLASSTLVSTTIRAVHRLPSPPTSSVRSTDPGKQNPPSQTPTASWLAPVSRGYQTADISA